MLQRLADYFFGYDFFLSYAHQDGKNYPANLRERLERAGFRVFIDQTEYVPGLDLRRETNRQIRKSQSIVLIARPASLRSEWVRKEVDVALSIGRIPLLIDINGSVTSAPAESSLAALAREQHWLRLIETIPALDDPPSEHAISELMRTFAHTRRETIRQRVLAFATLVFALLSAITGYAWWRAETERVRAEHTTAVASNAANSLVFNIAGRFKEREGMPQGLVVAILQQAQDLSKKLAELGQPPPDVIRSGGAALAEISAALRRQGKYEEAIATARQAIVQFKRLTELQSDKLAGLSELATAYDRLGEALRASGNKLEASKAFEEGREINTALVQAFPDSPNAMRALATSKEKISDLLMERGALSEALVGFDQSRELRERILSSIGDPEVKRELAVSHERIAVVHLKTGNVAAALAQYTGSMEITQALADSDPEQTDWQRDLAIIHQQLGALHRHENQVDKAIQHFRAVEQITRRLSQKDPERDQWQLDAARSCNQLGEALLELKGQVEAVEFFLRAKRYYEKQASNRDEWHRIGFTAASNLGVVLHAQDRSEESGNAFQIAKLIATRLVEASTSTAEMDRKLVWAVRQEAEARQRWPEAVEAHLLLVDTLKQVAVRRANARDALPDALGNLSWYAVLAGQFEAAAKAAREALVLQPAEAWIELNEAHATMFLGKRAESRAMYLRVVDASKDVRATRVKSILADFSSFRKYGMSHPQMEEIESLLPPIEQ